MIDNHVHVGWYKDGYHSPQEVWQSEQEAGINEIAVSSTSTCAELYKLVVREMRELIKLGGSRIHPILWLTPRMMKTWGIRYMLRSKIHWQGVKMHWYAHHEWYHNQRLTNQALQVARRLDVPVLLHTGCDKDCLPTSFLPYIKANPGLTFVLAHGRPEEETIVVMGKCPNTMTDTAFMSPEEVKHLIEKGYIHRVLFGTDAPINRFVYKDLPTSEYIRRCLADLKNDIGDEHFNTILSNNIYT